MQDDPPPKPNLSKSIPCIQRLHGIIQSLLMLSLPQTTGDPSLRWLILDGRKLALSHGCGKISYNGIVLAVQSLWNKGHRKLIVCVPEWMKTHEDLPYLENNNLIELHQHLAIFFAPSENKEASFMDALARAMDALIVTQLGPDTWSEPKERIVEFFFRDDFILPEYQWGKDGPSLSTLLRLRKPKDISVQKLVQDLMLERRVFSEILTEPRDLSLSEEPGRDPRLVIIDGSNVAMRHGLNRFYSCLGIYLAVQYIWNKGYRNITVFVPKCRKNSICTVYGYEYLDILYKKGLLIFTPSLCYDDEIMLKIAKEKNGMIVTNDKFKDFGEEWEDVINECIPFEFDGNQFIAFLKASEAVVKSTVQHFVGEESACLPKTGQTLHPVLPLPVEEAVKTRGELCCGKIVKKMMSRSKQDNPPSWTTLPHDGSIQNLLILPLPKTEGDPSLRWLILDGRRLALSHGCGEIYSYDGITLAVQDLWKKHHRKLIVCVPEWMKAHGHLPDHENNLIELQHHLFIVFVPSEAMEASSMDVVAREMDALIVTQRDLETWFDSKERIVEFLFYKDSFILPEDQWGKKGPKLSSVLRSGDTREISVQKLVQDLMLERRVFSEILTEPRDLSLSEEPGRDPRLVIIDGSNVAMSHGLNRFYSCPGIQLAVQYIWNKGCRNITVFVPNWRYNSRYTVYGQECLNMLYEKGILILAPSLSYVRIMLEEAKEKNGMIVTNDEFKDFGEEWEDVINERIPFEFTGNHFIAFLKGSEAVGKSSVRPSGVVEGSACLPNSGQTLHPDPPRPEDEDTI